MGRWYKFSLGSHTYKLVYIELGRWNKFSLGIHTYKLVYIKSRVDEISLV